MTERDPRAEPEDTHRVLAEAGPPPLMRKSSQTFRAVQAIEGLEFLTDGRKALALTLRQRAELRTLLGSIDSAREAAARAHEFRAAQIRDGAPLTSGMSSEPVVAWDSAIAVILPALREMLK